MFAFRLCGVGDFMRGQNAERPGRQKLSAVRAGFDTVAVFLAAHILRKGQGRTLDRISLGIGHRTAESNVNDGLKNSFQKDFSTLIIHAGSFGRNIPGK